MPCYTFGRTVIATCNDVIVARQVRGKFATSQPSSDPGQRRVPLTVFNVCGTSDSTFSDGRPWTVNGRGGSYTSTESPERLAPVRMTGNYGSENRSWKMWPSNLKPLREDLFEPGFAPADSRGFNKCIQMRFQRRRYTLNSSRFQSKVPWQSLQSTRRGAITIGPFAPRICDNDSRRPPPPSSRQSHWRTRNPSLRLIAKRQPPSESDSNGFAEFSADQPVGGDKSSIKQWQDFTFKESTRYDYGMPQWLASKSIHVLRSTAHRKIGF